MKFLPCFSTNDVSISRTFRMEWANDVSISRTFRMEWERLLRQRIELWLDQEFGRAIPRVEPKRWLDQEIGI